MKKTITERDNFLNNGLQHYFSPTILCTKNQCNKETQLIKAVEPDKKVQKPYQQHNSGTKAQLFGISQKAEQKPY